MQNWITWQGRGMTSHNLPLTLTKKKKKRSRGGLGNIYKLINICQMRIFPVKAFGQSNKIWPDPTRLLTGRHRQKEKQEPVPNGKNYWLASCSRRWGSVRALWPAVGMPCLLTSLLRSAQKNPPVFAVRPMALSIPRARVLTPKPLLSASICPWVISETQLPTMPETLKWSHQQNGLVPLVAY